MFIVHATRCRASLQLAVTAISFVSTVFTLFQFFLRVRVIYCEDNRLKTGLFAALWLLASGGASFNLDFSASGRNADCSPQLTALPYVVSVSAILAYDSCVFLAISYQLYKMSLELVWTNPRFHQRSGPGARMLALWGKELPSLTRAILYDGQFYYFNWPHNTCFFAKQVASYYISTEPSFGALSDDQYHGRVCVQRGKVGSYKGA
ncbi:hypothetical protein BDP27DRAFT_1317740 [Rhodocollybia butyracea]|uniref:Uncharacterized protein n=1 Tax=Rhodocollybia butyracea TaxID=206335 RepID=A0A9P5UD83_9AGAR|nr:hypothetical protein BDP27DRAFT_1317740 [Rhodocollybia butyracea]